MPSLIPICQLINAQLQSTIFATQPFQHAKFDDLADLVSTETEDGKTMRPVIIDNDGEMHDLVIDDTYSMQVYHRNLNLVYEDDDNEDFGNGGNITKETADMLLVIIGDKARLGVGVYEYDVSAGVWANIPRTFSHATLTTLQLGGCLIVPGEANLDVEDNYKTEYEGVTFELKPNYFMISLKYKIVSLFNKNCFKLC